ncbi:MAG: class I SAM-dependent methyltransferase [Dehalococcoidia bacterium]
MPETTPLTPDSVRAEWDFAANAYAQFQAAGNDDYRYRLFGPAHVALCGEVSGLDVLDIGCGNGYLSRALAAKGARVTGVDLSPNQIAHAERIAREQPDGVHYEILDAARILDRFGPASFDVVTACLSLQDMPDPHAVIASVAAVLRPGGRFVVSLSHPVTDTPVHRWVTDETGTRTGLVIGKYYEKEPMSFTWRGARFAYDFTTRSARGTLAEWVNWLVGAGLDIRRFEEPRPSPATVEAAPNLFDATLVPTFLLIASEKRPAS